MINCHENQRQNQTPRRRDVTGYFYASVRPAHDHQSAAKSIGERGGERDLQRGRIDDKPALIERRGSIRTILLIAKVVNDGVAAVRRHLEHDTTTVASIAVAWCLSHPGVTAAIVGARRPSQVDGWIGAPDIELTTTDLTDIADAIHRTGAGHGGR